MKHDKWSYGSWMIVVWLIFVPIIMLHRYNEEVSGGFPMPFGAEFGEDTHLVWKGILFTVVSFITAVGLNPAFAIDRFSFKKWGL